MLEQHGCAAPLQEWEDAKAKQDKQLDRVGNVVDRLKEIANNMGDEVSARFTPRTTCLLQTVSAALGLVRFRFMVRTMVPSPQPRNWHVPTYLAPARYSLSARYRCA
jgi:hypothetical protein